MEQAELVVKIKNYMRQVLWANDCFDAYISIYNCSKKYYNEITTANNFFTITRYALASSLMLELCKIYDNREKNSIWKLLSYVKESRALFPEGKYLILWEENKPVNGFDDFLSAAENTLHTLDAPISKIKKRRDKYYAHNDTEFFSRGTSLTEKYPISIDEVKLLLTFSAGFCNSLLGALDNLHIYPRHLGTGDLERLLFLAHQTKAGVKLDKGTT